MNRLRVRRDDDGQVLVAMLGILIMTTVTLVGLAAVLMGQRSARFDTRFEQALSAAETGLDRMLTQVRATPFATSYAPVTGQDGASSWTVTASGTPGSWVLTSVGTSTDAKGSVSRRVRERVEVSDLLEHALFADTSLTLGGDADESGVDRYSTAVSSSVCGTSLLGTGLLSNGARMCTPASPGLGAMGTNGPLTMPGASLSGFDRVDVYDAGVAGYATADDRGRCVGDAAACAAVGGKVQLHEQRKKFPLSDLCQNGIGAGAAAYDGSLALAANAVYSFTDVTLNATAIANLGNLSGSTIVICFSGTLLVPPAVPLNFLPESLLPLRLAPRPPATLLLISTAQAGPTPPRVELGLPAGLNLGLPVSLSGVVYAPNATCTAHGHVDLYGAIVCGSMDARDGINVHFDTQLGDLPLDRPVTVSGWQEISAAELAANP